MVTGATNRAPREIASARCVQMTSCRCGRGVLLICSVVMVVPSPESGRCLMGQVSLSKHGTLLSADLYTECFQSIDLLSYLLRLPHIHVFYVDLSRA